MNRKQLLLAILSGLLILSLAYAFWAMPRQKVAPPADASAERPAARIAKTAKSPPKAAAAKSKSKVKSTSGRLDLALLKEEVTPFPETGRNIFRFNDSWNAASSAAAELAEAVIEEPPPPPPPPPPLPEEVLQRDLGSYKVSGYLEKKGARTVFLTGGNDVFLAKAGQFFGPKEQFVIVEINPAELVVAYRKDRSVLTRLPLLGKDDEPASISPVSVSRPAIEAEPPAAESPAADNQEKPRPPARRARTSSPLVPLEEAPQEESAPDGGAANKHHPSGEE